MQDRENRDETPPRGDERQTNGSGPELNPDQELVYRLKNAIDQRGRYSFRLNDMAAGFAAGQNISNASARRNIEDRFIDQVGLSPQEYLDRHYAERRQQNGRESTRSRQRDNGHGRER